MICYLKSRKNSIGSLSPYCTRPIANLLLAQPAPRSRPFNAWENGWRGWRTTLLFPKRGYQDGYLWNRHGRENLKPLGEDRAGGSEPRILSIRWQQFW